jgi:hypothetical protein
MVLFSPSFCKRIGIQIGIGTLEFTHDTAVPIDNGSKGIKNQNPRLCAHKFLDVNVEKMGLQLNALRGSLCLESRMANTATIP